MVTYRATLDVPMELVRYLARLLRAHRRSLATDHTISRAIAYRYIDEGTTVLAELAPDLHQALEQAQDNALDHLVLDGIVIPTDRCSEKTTSIKGEQIDLWYPGKAHTHGGNVQGLMAPNGFPLFVSEVEPGSVHDLTAARPHVLGALYPAASTGLMTLADAGYEGAGIGIITPVKRPNEGPPLALDNRTANKLQRGVRCLGERGFALLTQRWRLLQHITASPGKIGDIAKAALVLTHFEHGRSV